MRVAELLVRMGTFEVMAGSPHLAEVSRVEALHEGAHPLPGTLYLVEDGNVLMAWLEVHRRSNLLRHLAFVLPARAEFRTSLALKANVVVLRYAAPRLPLDLGAQILRILYEEHRPPRIDAEQLRKEIVEEVLRGGFRSINTLLARASALGLVLEPKRQVLLVDFDNPDTFYLEHLAKGEDYFNRVRGRMLLLARGILLEDSPHHVVSPHGTGVVALLDRRGAAGPTVLAERIAEALRRQLEGLEFVVALGNPCPSPAELAQSYREAQVALEVRRLYGLKAPWISFESARPLIFLHALGQNAELAGLAEAVLEPLQAVEPRYRRALLETLVAYLEHNRSVRRASEALGLHPNTLKYRLRRLEELLDLRDADSGRRLLYHVAAKLALLKMQLSP